MKSRIGIGERSELTFAFDIQTSGEALVRYSLAFLSYVRDRGCLMIVIRRRFRCLPGARHVGILPVQEFVQDASRIAVRL